MKKALAVIAAVGLLAGCSTNNQTQITPAQVTLATATAVAAVQAAGQLTPQVKTQLETAAAGLSAISQGSGTNMTTSAVLAAVNQIADPKARAAVLVGVSLWQLVGSNISDQATLATYLKAVSDGIYAGLGEVAPATAAKLAARGRK